jgi:hypothetical protein
MPDFNVRSDAVNVEQIMEQIRARIKEKRGVDYTEAQIKELASVKLEKFLDPRGVRSDLLEQFRRAQPTYAPPELPNFAFEDQTLFESTRGPLRFIRRLLLPILKLFFNPNPLIQALNIQSRLNARAGSEARRAALRLRPVALRGDAQPRHRNHAARHRGQEPEDAARVAGEPARVQRAARACARERRRLQAGQRRAATTGEPTRGVTSRGPAARREPPPGHPAERTACASVADIERSGR